MRKNHAIGLAEQFPKSIRLGADIKEYLGGLGYEF